MNEVKEAIEKFIGNNDAMGAGAEQARDDLRTAASNLVVFALHHYRGRHLNKALAASKAIAEFLNQFDS